MHYLNPKRTKLNSKELIIEIMKDIDNINLGRFNKNISLAKQDLPKQSQYTLNKPVKDLE